MRIEVNGESREVTATTLSAVLEELGYGDDRVATAVNESFVPATARDGVTVAEGDRIEIVAPRQGG